MSRCIRYVVSFLALILLLAVPTPTFAQLALVATYSGITTGATTTTTASVTYGTGDTIVVWVSAIFGSTETISIADGTNTYAVKTPYAQGTGPYTHRGAMAIAENVTAGSYTVTATFSGTIQYPGIYVWRISGAAHPGFDVNDADFGGQAFVSDHVDVGPITTTQAAEIILVGAANFDNKAWSFDNSFTVDNDGTGGGANGRNGAGHKIVSGIQSALTVRATMSGQVDGIAGILSVKEAGAGGGGASTTGGLLLLGVGGP